MGEVREVGAVRETNETIPLINVTDCRFLAQHSFVIKDKIVVGEAMPLESISNFCLVISGDDGSLNPNCSFF